MVHDLLTKSKPDVIKYRPAITEYLEGRTMREREDEKFDEGSGMFSTETKNKIWKAERRFEDECDNGYSNRKMRGF